MPFNNNSTTYGNTLGSSYRSSAASEGGATDCLIIVGGEKDPNIYEIREVIPALIPLTNGQVTLDYATVVASAPGQRSPQARFTILRCSGGKLPPANVSINPTPGVAYGFDTNKYEILFDTVIMQWGPQVFRWEYHPDIEDDTYAIVSKPNQPLIVLLSNGSYWQNANNLSSQAILTMSLNVHAVQRKGGTGSENQRVAGNYRLGDV